MPSIQSIDPTQGGEDAPPAAILRMRVLGPFELRTSAGVSIHLAGSKTTALLGILACSRHGATTRERLCELLWSHVAMTQARDSLRQVARRLSRSLHHHAPDAVLPSRQHLRLDSRIVRTDIAELAALIARSPDSESDDPAVSRCWLQRFESIWRGDLLEQQVCGDAAFDSWIACERAHLREQAIAPLAKLLRNVNRAGHAQVQEHAARLLLKIEWFNEAALRIAIEARARFGDRAGALATFADFEKRLCRELDARPAARTLDLVAAINAGAFSAGSPALDQTIANAAPAPPRRTLPPGRPIVHVSPITEIGIRSSIGDEVASAIHTDFVDRLARHREFGVCDTPHYSALGKATPTSSDLRIECILRSNAGDFRLYVRLRALASTHILWTDTFDIDDAVSKGSIAPVVAATVDAIRHHLWRRAGEADCDDPIGDALAHWNASRKQAIVLSPHSYARGVELVERAVRLNDDLATAKGCLAGFYALKGLYVVGYVVGSEKLAQARRLGERAVELDPFDARVQLNLGWIAAIEREFPEAVSRFGQAVMRDSSDAHLLMRTAMGLAYAGETGAALELAEDARRLARVVGLDVRYLDARISLASGRPHQAIEQLHEAPSTPVSHGAVLAIALASAGAHGDARAAMREFLASYNAPEGQTRLTHAQCARWLEHTTPMPSGRAAACFHDSLQHAGLR